MKKNLLWLLPVTAALTLTACGNTSTTADTDYGEVTLCDYTNLSANKTVAEVTDDDIEEEIDSLLIDYLEYNEVDRPSQDGDYVAVNMTGTKDGTVILDYASEEYDIYLGSAEFGEDFDAKLTGVSAGDTLSFSLDYPDDYEDGDYAGATVDYDITVINVTEEVYPELTDAFISEHLDYDTYDDMVAGVTADLKASNEADGEYELRENLLQQVIDGSDITSYSDELYESAASSVEESYSSYAEMFGYDSVDDVYELFGMTDEDVEKEVLNQVYRTVVVDAICKKENLTLSDSEYQDGLARYAEENDYDSTDDLIADYGEDSIRLWLLDDKVLDLLEKNATITEVAATEEATTE